MKTLVLALALLASLCIATAQAQTKTYKLTFIVSNIMERTGVIHLGLVTKAENFMGKAEIDTAVAVPASGPLTITFNLPSGTYAARLYQDLNDNKQLDRQNGMPTEPFGFSKITRLMGPPSFDDASFDLTSDTEMKISLMSL